MWPKVLISRDIVEKLLFTLRELKFWLPIIYYKLRMSYNLNYESRELDDSININDAKIYR